MPRDRPRTGHSQAETEEESQNEFGMPELLDAVLNRHPRIARRILAVSATGLGHLFRWVGAERRGRQPNYEYEDGDGTEGAQRSSRVAIRLKKMR